jgi:uncharacterized RDD family membrane protein YckC
MTEHEYAKADSSLGVLTPEGIEFALFPAGLPIRACAWGIDKLIQMLALVIIQLSGIFWKDLGGIWLQMLLALGVEWFYHCIFELFFRGQSLGKRIMGIRVVRDDGSPVNPGASLLRNLLRFADTFMFLNLIAFSSMAVSRGFKRLGDWAAGTLVVYTAKSLSAPRRLPGSWLGDFPPPAAAPALSAEEKQVILMFARRYPLLGAARGDDISGAYVRALGAGPSGASAYLLGLARKMTGDQS